LPGTWPGIRYDSVTGEAEFPVLVRSSSGCLAGTGRIQTRLDPRTASLLSKGVAHVLVTGDVPFSGRLSLVRPSAYIGHSSGEPFGMDVTWGDGNGNGNQLVLSGTPSPGRTSSRFVLGLALYGEGLFFLSRAGECTVKITLDRPGRVRGSLACTGMSESRYEVDLMASFSGS